MIVCLDCGLQKHNAGLNLCNPCRRKRDPKFAAYMNAKTQAWRKKNPGAEKAYRKVYSKQYRAKNAKALDAQKRADKWLKQYGIGAERKEEIEARLAGPCEICDESGKLMHIDHDHNQPGTFRGILCARCNMFLGHYESHKNSGLLEQMDFYLHKHNPVRMCRV